MTKTSTMMGSPLYMSPEQLHSSKDVDSRTDIWALGVILYELVAGKLPFFADSVAELVTRILTEPPPPLRDMRPDVPGALEAVILRCLEKDRSRRFESVGELAGALQSFASRRGRLSLERISGVMRSAGLSASALAMPPSSDSPEQGAGRTQGAWGRTSPPSVTGRRTLLVGALVTALAVGGYWFLGPRSVGGGPAVSPTAGERTVTLAPERTASGPVQPQPSAEPSVTVTPAEPGTATVTPVTSTDAAASASPAQTGAARAVASPAKSARRPATTRPAAARTAKPIPRPRTAARPEPPQPPPSAVVTPVAEKPKQNSAFDDRQ